MRVIVVGCGRVGARLADRLFQAGNQVTVIDEVASAFDNLNADFRGRTLEGDVLAQDLLRRAGIEQADGLAAVTSSDTLNAVVAYVARTVFHVPNVVARNYEPHSSSLYEAFNVQIVGPSSWGAQRMEEMLYDSGIRAVFSAGNGEIEVYELNIPEAWGGRRVADLLSCADCRLVALTRAGKASLPGPDRVLETGDVVHLSATFESIESLRQQLAKTKGA